MVKYSFVVAVYNVEKYLVKCIESLINQDFNTEAYEIVLVDDGSLDSSGNICDEYADNFEKISVIHQSNGGLSQARKAGVIAAQGEYLVFIDSDDFVDSNLLSVVDGYLGSKTFDFLMYSYYRMENGDDKPVYLVDEPIRELSQRDFFDLITAVDKYNGIAGKVVRASIFKDHIDEIYARSFNVGEDKIQTAYLTKYIEQCAIIRDCPYHYVIRKDSVIHKKDEADLQEAMQMYSLVKQIIKDILAIKGWSDVNSTELFNGYDAMAIDGILDHIFKYNKRNDISISDKILVMNRIRSGDNSYFCNKSFYYKSLSAHNKVRYALFYFKRFYSLVLLDMCLSRMTENRGY